MTKSAELEGSSAFVSDIAFNQVERLFSPGRHSLAALADLVELAQAAIFNEELVVTAGAYENARALSDLDFVKPFAPEVEVTEAEEDTGPDPENGETEDKGGILIDVNEEGYLKSSHPVGELLLATLHSVNLRSDPLFGSLANPGGFEGEAFSSEEAIARFPILMLALQADRGLLAYDSEEARQSLEGRLSESIDLYNAHAVSMNALHQRWGMDTVLSVLEQPFAGTRIVDHALEFAESDSPAETRQLRELLGGAAMKVPGRAEFFEHWNMPPLGVIALAEAKAMDDVPRVLRDSRKRFSKLRDSICRLRTERAALVERADLSSRAGELALRELGGFDAEMRAALEAATEELSVRRSRLQRTELFFSTLDFALELLGGLGVGTVGKVIDALGLKRGAVMQRIPGLFRAVNFVRAGDDVLASDVVERLIGRLPSDLEGQRFVLDLGLAHGRRYSDSSPSRPPPAETAVRIEGEEGTTEVTDRDFWRLSCTVDGFLGIFSFP
ncbi:MAG: hypothetical protein QNJ30_19110 [Kiloniellales bacterium]|nr:hypothetical protein [Kiloniellales bacterium]